MEKASLVDKGGFKLDKLTRPLHWLVSFLKVRRRLTRGSHILRACTLQNILRALHPVRVVAMNRKEDSAFFYSSLIAFSFKLRNTHAYKCARNPAERAADSQARKRRDNRTRCDQWTHARNRERADSR